MGVLKSVVHYDGCTCDSDIHYVCKTCDSVYDRCTYDGVTSYKFLLLMILL